MRTSTLLTLVTAISISAATVATVEAAPFGSAFTYQGRLNVSGAPAADGLYDFRFTLHDAVTLGSSVGGAATVSAVPVTNGLFTASLDFGAPAFASGEARWLQLQVNTNGVTPLTTLSPRQRLAPTPQAVYAGQSGQAATASSVAAGAVTSSGLAPGSVGSTAIADGSIGAAELSSGLIEGTFWKLGGNNGAGNFLGTLDNRPLEMRVNNQTALRLLPDATSPNLVGGHSANSVSGGGFGAFIGGGGSAASPNAASGNFTVVTGGSSNSVFGVGAVVGGGMTNRAGGMGSMVGGGFNNLAMGELTFIGGGQANVVTGYTAGAIAFPAVHSSIVGGASNVIGGAVGSTIGGGFGNSLIGIRFNEVNYATIGGGQGNAVVPDTFPSRYSTIGGGLSNVVRTAGRATIGGGDGNRMFLEGNFASIGGGQGNTANGEYAAISGGRSNFVVGPGSHPRYATIGGGNENGISFGSSSATIAGGSLNRIENSARGAAIGGGGTNGIVGAEFGTIGGGSTNSVTGDFGTVPGGRRNRAIGSDSFAAGRRAVAQHDGSFVWADDTDADFSSTASKQFAVRASNGVMVQSATTALDLRGGGALRVAGAGPGGTGPVFIHKAIAANINGNTTVIDHPHCNGDPNAVLIVTPNWNPGGVGGTYNNNPIGVFYHAALNRWGIFNQNIGAAMPVNAAFNVMVVKP